MRKLVGVLGVVTVVLLVGTLDRPAASASDTCTASCSGGATLACVVANGTCSSSDMTSVTCCGATHTCTAINQWDACRANCTTLYNECVSTCRVFDPCVENCVRARTTCQNDCGTMPQITFSC